MDGGGNKRDAHFPCATKKANERISYIAKDIEDGNDLQIGDTGPDHGRCFCTHEKSHTKGSAGKHEKPG